ncbi:MAG: SDR family oxidoreductase [Alphaproteobacteria bacterium]|nr:SDR family oxidoreductase [Alphaproteobacteria bacterium]
MAAQGIFDLAGQVAVITGSSKGIGRAIAHALARHGAKVVISSRKAPACEAVAAEIRGFGGEALVVPANISDKAQLSNLVETTLAKWGRIDTLVCNAAVNPFYGPMSAIPDEAWDKIMASNIRSNLWLCNLALPHMAARKDGSVIVVSSIGGLRGSGVLGAYAVSKAADMQFVRNLAVEWGKHNIRANCIAPGLVKTDFARALWENPETLKRANRTSPLGRIGEPDEIAGCAVWLASASGRFTTGTTIVIDGGVTISGNAD